MLLQWLFSGPYINAYVTFAFLFLLPCIILHLFIPFCLVAEEVGKNGATSWFLQLVFFTSTKIKYSVLGSS